MGALNAVEIAAATPQPTPTVAIHRLCRLTRATRDPRVAPRWASGPYCPTDAPAPSDTTLVSAERKPERAGIRPSSPCTERMTSGGAVGAALRDQVPVHEPDDEPARGGHSHGGEEQQRLVVLHEAAARGDEQPLVEEQDEVHEPDRGKGGQRSRHHAESGNRHDPPGPCSARGPSPPHLTSPRHAGRPVASGANLDHRHFPRTVFRHSTGALRLDPFGRCPSVSDII